jgi:hypothetical protein
VQPDHPADDLRLKQVRLELILDDQHADQDHGIQPSPTAVSAIGTMRRAASTPFSSPEARWRS